MWFSVVLPVLAAYGSDCSEETALKLVIVFDVSYSTGMDHLRRQVAVANSILERVRKETTSLHWGVVLFATHNARLMEIELDGQSSAHTFEFPTLRDYVHQHNAQLQGNSGFLWLKFGATNYGPALTEAKRMLEGYPDAPLITGNVKRVKSQIIILTDGEPTDLRSSSAMRRFRQDTFANTEISIGAALLTKHSLANLFSRKSPLSILKDLCCGSSRNCDDHVGHFKLTSATAGGDWAAKLFGNLVHKNICGEEPPIPESPTAETTPAYFEKPTLADTGETTPANFEEPTLADTGETTPASTEDPTLADTEDPTLADTEDPTLASTGEAKGGADKEAETSGLDIMQFVLGLLAIVALFLCVILCLYCHKRKRAEEESMVADFKPATGRPREKKPRVRVKATKR